MTTSLMIKSVNDQVSLNVVAAFNLAFAQEQQCASDIQFNGSKL